MVDPPFDLLSCSWPRPVRHEGGRWLSDPDWEAPPLPAQPSLTRKYIHGELYWSIDWRELFAGDLKFWSPRGSGEMRGFHVVFRLRIRSSGTLTFWDDDGCVMRRRGRLIHEDRSSHQLSCNEISVSAGDPIEVAHWQYNGEWIWAARVTANKGEGRTPTDRP
jgi:hypothetical protein